MDAYLLGGEYGTERSVVQPPGDIKDITVPVHILDGFDYDVTEIFVRVKISV